ncbi:non-histone chromosomal protein HMG-14-like [Bos taurus]|uniref:non-histone chromosomal protein HMG-14-like n=1 Tax=Bos taurus TaxID=9913 RepID=UPI00017C4083|nr:non-histone chromosomal protein HMG-14-like [Bos taurus]
MPQRRVSAVQSAVKREPKRCARLSVKLVATNVKMNPEKAAGKAKSLGRKVQTNGKRETNGKQAEETKELKTDLPEKNRERAESGLS